MTASLPRAEPTPSSGGQLSPLTISGTPPNTTQGLRTETAPRLQQTPRTSRCALRRRLDSHRIRGSTTIGTRYRCDVLRRKRTADRFRRIIDGMSHEPDHKPPQGTRSSHAQFDQNDDAAKLSKPFDDPRRIQETTHRLESDTTPIGDINLNDLDPEDTADELSACVVGQTLRSQIVSRLFG